MELRHLKYFVIVAEELSFTKAAARLRISQPPLTAQIHTLEEELNLQLFNRTKQKVELTQAGQIFLAEARLTLSQAQRTKKLASQLASGSIGEVRVGFTLSAAMNPAVPRMLNNFRTENPAIHLALQEMLTKRQIDCLRRNELDVGFCRELISITAPPELTIERILQERFVAVLPSRHQLARQNAISVKACVDEPFIFFSPALGVGLYDKVIGLCAKAGFKPRIVQEANGVIAIVSLVASGIGISILPESVKSIALEGVVYRSLRSPDAVIPLMLAFRESDDAPVVSRFVAHVRRAIGAQSSIFDS
jgi:DNA-binding transcriptional LysR family regulator